MRVHKLLLSLALVPVLGGCLEMSMSSGSMGSKSFLPWTIQTELAYWDVHEFKQESDGRMKLQERGETDGGAALNIQLYGFYFNAWDDRRLWHAEDWRRFRTGIATQPAIRLRVRQAQKLGSGDEISFDTENTSMATARDPFLDAVDYSPGQPALNEGSTYPDEAKPMGSHLKGKLTITGIDEQAGFGHVLRGTLEYEVKKSDRDPPNVVEGKITVNFGAVVVGERLAECNDSTTELGNFTSTDACNYLGE